MHREILLTGIGGQGIQLAARTLALAAIQEDRQVMVFGSYGGSMRGGNSEATIVVADGPIETPPTVTAADFALGMHPAHWYRTANRLAPGAIAVVDTSVFREEVHIVGHLVGVEASTLATSMRIPHTATMVGLGALTALTKLVGSDSLIEAGEEALPPYRARHAAEVRQALQTGIGLFQAPLVDSWVPRGEVEMA